MLQLKKKRTESRPGHVSHLLVCFKNMYLIYARSLVRSAWVVQTTAGTWCSQRRLSAAGPRHLPQAPGLSPHTKPQLPSGQLGLQAGRPPSLIPVHAAGSGCQVPGRAHTSPSLKSTAQRATKIRFPLREVSLGQLKTTSHTELKGNMGEEKSLGWKGVEAEAATKGTQVTRRNIIPVSPAVSP